MEETRLGQGVNRLEEAQAAHEGMDEGMDGGRLQWLVSFLWPFCPNQWIVSVRVRSAP